MTRDDIIRLAREVGGVENATVWLFDEIELERFAALVAQAERDTWANETTLKLITEWKYMVGIAERGFGAPLPEGMAGADYLLLYVKELEARERAVAAAEREACAKVCDAIAKSGVPSGHDGDKVVAGDAHDCAVAIRAMGGK
jgi:hypothetical protein